MNEGTETLSIAVSAFKADVSLVLQLQELAQQQLLQAFTEALHHVSQSTLITQVMQLLPLPSYSQQLAHPDPLSTSQLRVTLPRPSARQAQDSTLDQPLDSRKSSMADPLAMLHLKKRRSQRPTRPASAGIPGMQTRFSICARQSGYPSESSDEDQAPISQEEADQIGGMQMGMKQWELGQHNCSKQDWSQLDWSKQLPASTSALLQAVEMAAAAERPGRVCPVTGMFVACLYTWVTPSLCCLSLQASDAT